MDDYPELISRFSSDGEESFLGRPEARSYSAVSRGEVQKFTNHRVVNETGAEEELGSGYSRHSSKLASRPRPPTLFNRLTSKLRIATPPNTPPLTPPSYNPLSPTRRNITHETNPFASRELREAALRERGLSSPKDLSVQEREQDRYLATIAQNDIFEQGLDKKKVTESKRIQEEWKAKNQVITNSEVERSIIPARPLRPRGPIYPAVLATPQFGRSKSTPDIAKHIRRSEEAGVVNQSAAVQLIRGEPAVLRSPRETQLSNRPPVHDETRSSATSSALSPSAQKLSRPPDRNLPPVPTGVNPSPASPFPAIEVSSRCSVSSGRNSSFTTSPFTPTSQGFTLDTSSTPTSSGRRGYGRDSSEREAVSQSIGATGEGTGDSVRGPTIDRALLTVDNHTRGGEASQAVSTVTEESDRDIARSTFSVKRPKRRERVGSKDGLTAWAPRRPSTADPPRPKTSESTNGFQGRSQRRKLFLGQSLHNLRKSVTDSITKTRPQPPAITPSTSFLMPQRYDISQLPPSPTLPFPSSPVSDYHSPSARRSLSFNAHR